MAANEDISGHLRALMGVGPLPTSWWQWIWRPPPLTIYEHRPGVFTISWRRPSPVSNHRQERVGAALGACVGCGVVLISPLGPIGRTSATLNDVVLFFVALGLAALIGFAAGRRFYDWRINDEETNFKITSDAIEWSSTEDPRCNGAVARSPAFKPIIQVRDDKAYELAMRRRLMRMGARTDIGDPAWRLVMTLGQFGVGWRTLGSIAATNAHEEAGRMTALLNCILDLTDPHNDAGMVLEEFTVSITHTLKRSRESAGYET